MAFDLTFDLELDLAGFDEVEAESVVGLDDFEDFADFEDFEADADVDTEGISLVYFQDWRAFIQVKQEVVLGRL